MVWTASARYNIIVIFLIAIFPSPRMSQRAGAIWDQGGHVGVVLAEGEELEQGLQTIPVK